MMENQFALKISRGGERVFDVMARCEEAAGRAAATGETEAFTEATTRLEPGSTIVLYRDGLVGRRDMGSTGASPAGTGGREGAQRA